MSRVSAFAVTRITGIALSLASRLSSRTTEMPSSFGIMMSRRIRSGSSSRARASPSSPSAAVWTSYPFASRRTLRISRFSGVSSTARMRGVSRTGLVLRLTQEFVDLGEELARAEGLGDIAVAACSLRLRLVAGEGVGGDRDDRDVLQRRIGLDPPGGLVAVEHRELDVHQDQVRLVLDRHGEAGGAVMRLQELVADAVDEVADDLPVVLGVLDHQDTLRHAASICSAALTGTAIRNVEPSPRTDSTSMVPPCIATSRCEIARPRPVPPFWRVELLSTCWNSSKMRFWSSGAMPGPVSRTAMSKKPSAAPAAISTEPLSVNLIALPTRFSSTCVSRRSSPRPIGSPSCTFAVSASSFALASDSVPERTVCTTCPTE